MCRPNVSQILKELYILGGPRGSETIAAQGECAAAADLIVREHSAALDTPPPHSSLTEHMYCGLASLWAHIIRNVL